jgi:hypothetical protein
MEVIARLRGLQKKISLHSKIVLLTTGALILAGACCSMSLKRTSP